MWQVGASGEFPDDDGTQEAAFVAQLQALFNGLADGVVTGYSLRVTTEVPLVPGANAATLSNSNQTVRQTEEAALQKAVSAALNKLGGANQQAVP